jgi:acetoin:2,6-dichlorophenolindophenol oxidoreductase subunit alpha
MRQLWAEYLGRATGSCHGKGGPMHITHPDAGVVVTTGIVGGGLPIAAGLGLSAVLLGTGQVTLVSFGDGAANIGAFHEALNLAGLWRLPVIFCCEGPTLVEAMTFRFHGHLLSDDMAYMPPGELDRARAADPVPAFRGWLLAPRARH